MSDDARARRLNESIVWKAFRDERLLATPNCGCGQPATEIHRPDGCLGAAPPADVEAVCRSCHDATGCTEWVTPWWIRCLVG